MLIQYLTLEEVANGVGVVFDFEADLAKAQVALADFDVALHRLRPLDSVKDQI